MKNLWPDSIKESNEVTPKEFIQYQTDRLEEITQGLVFAELTRKSVLSKLFTDERKYEFTYTMSLRSKYLQNYRFAVFTFKHNIPVYPVEFSIEDEIAAELGLPCDRDCTIDDQVELEGLLKGIFNSERLGKVIGTLMRMSRAEI